MILDAATLDRSLLPQNFDICIIGAGPAGITLARRLADAGATVALMEAGGFDISEESQDVYRGENVGRDYFELDTARLRYFGGTSNHWGGWCRALDLYDFAPRPFHPMSGWPIAELDLDPYRAEADRILDIPSATEAPDLPIKEKDYILRHFQFRFSPPTRFGEKYRDEIAASDRITLVLNANLVDLRLDGVLARVTGAVFRNYDPGDPGFTIAARAYALCCGGIENARLLLNFDSQVAQGIGNRTDMVGRCFCDHPHYVVGDVVLQTLVLEREFYSPFETFMLDQKCLNFGMRLEPGWIEPSDLPALATQVTDDEFAIHLGQRVRDSMVDLSATKRQPLPEPSPQTAVMRMAQEQQQNLESRVLLGDEQDAFGLRRVKLDWRLTDLDVHTMRTAATRGSVHRPRTDPAMAAAGPTRLSAVPGRRGRRKASHVHHPYVGGPEDRGRRCRLQGARRGEPLHRRVECLCHDRACKPYVHDHPARAAARGSSGRLAQELISHPKGRDAASRLGRHGKCAVRSRDRRHGLKHGGGRRHRATGPAVDVEKHLLGGCRYLSVLSQHRVQNPDAFRVGPENLGRDAIAFGELHLSQMSDMGLDGVVAVPVRHVVAASADERKQRVRGFAEHLQVTAFGHVSVVIDPRLAHRSLRQAKRRRIRRFAPGGGVQA